MADKHPYVQGPGSLVPVINQFRKSFPNSVTADTLKKLGFAPKNESYVLNVLGFLGLIDQEGKKTEVASDVFKLHDDDAFTEEFSRVVRDAYKELFELHGDEAWALDSDMLIAFFRQSDDTTDLVGKRQASTFKILASLSGHGELRTSRKGAVKKPVAPRKSVPGTQEKGLDGKVTTPQPHLTESTREARSFGLTVRIEINLPADGDKETYDRIFKSIRENLLNE